MLIGGIALILIAVIVFWATRKTLDEGRTAGSVIGGICGAIGLILVVISWLTIIPAGHVGVQILFGKVSDSVLEEGLRTRNPLAKVHKVSIQTQAYTMSSIVDEGEKDDRPDPIMALTKDNLTMAMDVTVLYQIVPTSADKTYRILGTIRDITEKIIRPSIRTAIRNSTAKFEASEVMGERRADAEKMIQSELMTIFKAYFDSREIEGGVLCERVMLRNVDPPPKLKEAIEDKLKAEQEKQAMDFILEKTKKEAEQKAIEAGGIAEAQRIINKSLTREYLQWYYIETLKQLVNSPNHSTLILPFDQKLTPMFNIK